MSSYTSDVFCSIVRKFHDLNSRFPELNYPLPNFKILNESQALNEYERLVFVVVQHITNLNQKILLIAAEQSNRFHKLNPNFK